MSSFFNYDSGEINDALSLISILPLNIKLAQHFKHHSDYTNDEYYHVVNNYWYDKKVDGPRINYRINKHGFRSQHFTKLNSNSYNILAGGCSWTFGEGVEENYRWSDLFKNKVRKDANIYNIGFMGHSIDLIIKNCLGFIREYGSPDCIVLLLPDTKRKVKFDDKRKVYRILAGHEAWLLDQDRKKDLAHFKYTLNYQYEDNIFDYVLLLNMFELFCQASNIKLIWSTWESDKDADVYNSLNFNNFLYINDCMDMYRLFDGNMYSDKRYIELQNNIDRVNYWMMGDDGSHPGVALHNYIADKFAERF